MPRPAPESLTLREATAADAESIVGIYNHYVTHSIATFEEESISADEMARRIEKIRSAALPWLAAEIGGRVVGYAYAGNWNERSAYRFTAEITVYLDPNQSGQGIGSSLYHRLFAILRERGIRSVIGGISLPNDASVALHEKFGLRKVAHFKEIGFKFNRWIDVGHWQGTL